MAEEFDDDVVANQSAEYFDFDGFRYYRDGTPAMPLAQPEIEPIHNHSQRIGPPQERTFTPCYIHDGYIDIVKAVAENGEITDHEFKIWHALGNLDRSSFVATGTYRNLRGENGR